MRPRGMPPTIWARASSRLMPPAEARASKSCSTRSVSIQPGSTLFTVMPASATSSARVLAQPTTAARMLLLRMSPGKGCFTDTLVMLITRPQPRARMPGSRARVMARAESRVEPHGPRCQAAPSSSSKRPGGGSARVVHQDVHPAIVIGRGSGKVRGRAVGG